MAKVDLKTSIVYIENIERIKIVTGTDFELILKRDDNDYDGPVDYASTGDPVLEITQPDGRPDTRVIVKAKTEGLSRFFFIQKAETGFASIKEIRIEVVDEIMEEAVYLGASGEPVDKESLSDFM